jgi:hypothetical protein
MRLTTAMAGLRHPVVAILLAIAFFTAISGKPLDGMLMLTVALCLARDAGRPGSDSTVAGAGTAPAHGAVPAAGRPAGAGTITPSAPAPAGYVPPRRPRLLAGTLVAGGAAYTGVVGSFGRYSWPATAGIVGLGSVVVLLGWRAPLRRGPAGARLPTAGTALWAGLFVAGCLWELTALLKQPTLTESSYAHPTVSTLADPVLASTQGRWAVLAAWLALGWYLVRR